MNAIFPPPGADIPLQRSRGSARMAVKSRDGKTALETLFQKGCAKIRIPRKAGQNLQAVMINSSGGLTGGDRMDWRFDIGADAKLAATTQACERIYRAAGGEVRTDIAITVGDGARFAWLPQETILFDGGRSRRSIDVTMAASAELLMVEPLLLGRKAMAETVRDGAFRDHWRVRRDGQLIHAENVRLEGAIAHRISSPMIAGGHTAFATALLVSPRAEALVPAVKGIVSGTGSASCWQDKLLVRLTAADGYALRRTLLPLIQCLDCGTDLPRVWSL